MRYMRSPEKRPCPADSSGEVRLSAGGREHRQLYASCHNIARQIALRQHPQAGPQSARKGKKQRPACWQRYWDQNETWCPHLDILGRGVLPCCPRHSHHPASPDNRLSCPSQGSNQLQAVSRAASVHFLIEEQAKCNTPTQHRAQRQLCGRVADPQHIRQPWSAIRSTCSVLCKCIVVRRLQRGAEKGAHVGSDASARRICRAHSRCQG